MIERSDTLNQFCVVEPIPHMRGIRCMSAQYSDHPPAQHTHDTRGAIHPVVLPVCESATSTPPFAGEDGVEKHVLPQAVFPRVLT
jgi:hypothetical protein